ncbi:MAG TPA: hypothetical protein VHH53_11580 [Pseudonocardiaceae bacterium]|nr:hypothetical protein [Pseudonocardiaceae bacterium]
MIEEAFGELAPLSSTTRACELLGVSRASLYRRRHPPPPAARTPRTPGVHPATLGDDERAQLLRVLNSDRFADRSPTQIWAILLDEGMYLASVSTMYRLLRHHDQTRERRAQATHPAKKKPELLATGPDQVWSWDITKLTGPARGVSYDLYVILDIFSRRSSTSTSTPPKPANSPRHSSTPPSPPTAAYDPTRSTPTAAPR